MMVGKIVVEEKTKSIFIEAFTDDSYQMEFRVVVPRGKTRADAERLAESLGIRLDSEAVAEIKHGLYIARYGSGGD